MGDRDLLSGLVQLVEKSPHIGLCYILSVQRKWIEDKDVADAKRESNDIDIYHRVAIQDRIHLLDRVQNWETGRYQLDTRIRSLLGSIEMNDPVLIEGRLPYPLPNSSEFLNWAESIKIAIVISSARQLLIDPAETEKIWRLQSNRRPSSSFGQISGQNLRCWYTAIENPGGFGRGGRFQSRRSERSHNENEHHPENSREVAGEAFVNCTPKWRRKSLCIETNAAMSYEQIGEWEAAEQAYEIAQEKARSNLLPFGQGEYTLGDHWFYALQNSTMGFLKRFGEG
ncbi:hypothetical protein PGT21_003579 [Puccinia graminis f. sp. tritici]|uniref:Uncharacterized protein n=1 Tax=Puccinia graminis f. sp. tritici TaxID=56615 RepID=A0A5B0QVI9_PUCGR|nr:hypothetical protein PGT21_003579 [Puccinia graminis f. sp. tritici]